MAFPTVKAKASTPTTASGVSHVVNLPSGIGADDLLVIWLDAFGTVNTDASATGWDVSGGNLWTAAHKSQVLMKKATGSEGATVTVTTNKTAQVVARAYRIEGWQGTTMPEVNGTAHSYSNSHNGAALDPAGWGTENTLWMALDFSIAGISGYPSNMANDRGSGSLTAHYYAEATAESAVSSFDPDPFASGSSQYWVVATVAVRPGVAGIDAIVIVPGPATVTIVAPATTIVEHDLLILAQSVLVEITIPEPTVDDPGMGWEMPLVQGKETATVVDPTGADTMDYAIPRRKPGGQWEFVDGATALGSFLPWFIVTAYGAVGDGTTDDTAAINAAIAALVAAGTGVLYFPGGTYKVTAGLTALSVNCLVLGDGANGTGTPAPSLITCTNSTAVVFSVTTNSVHFSRLAIHYTGGSTPTAGAGIQVPVGGATRSRGYDAIYDSLDVKGFWINYDLREGGEWDGRDCQCNNPVKYGVRIANTSFPDEGDWSMVGWMFSASVTSPDAAIRIESAGGGKIVNCKVNGSPSTGYGRGIDLAMATGVSTSVLLVSNTSIENLRGNGINIATAGTGIYNKILLAGIEFSLGSSSIAINISANTLGEITDVLIDDIIATSSGNANPVIALTKVTTARIGHVINDGFASVFTQSSCTGVVDDTGAIAAGVAITGTPSSGQVPTASSGTAAAWATPTAVPAFATPAIVLGTVAAAGAASTVIRSDATVVAFDATDPAAIGAAAPGNAATAARRNHVHPTGAGTPSTQAIGDAAAIGAGPAAAMDTHVHGMPAFGSPVAVGTANADGTAVTLPRSDHVHQDGPTHAHVAQEVHTSDGATVTFTLDQAYEPGTVSCHNLTTGHRVSVTTETLPDQAVIAAAGTAADIISFDYAALAV